MQLRGNFPCIRSYAEAEAYFNRTPARTGRKYKIEQNAYYSETRITGRPMKRTEVVTDVYQENERPLNSNTYLGYTRLIHYPNGDYAFRYHRTDVVIYRPDGSVTINPYESHSTQTFFDCFAPPRVNVRMRPETVLMLSSPDDDSYYWRDHPGRRLYQFNGGTLTPEGDTFVVNAKDTSTWETPVLNRKRAAELRKEYRLRDLAAFLVTARAMRQQQPGGFGVRLDQGLLAAVADPAQWIEIANSSLTSEEINKTVYKRSDALTTVSRPFLTSWAEVQAHRAAERRWGYV